MDAIEQLSGSFGDGELAAEVKRLRRELAAEREAVRVLGKEIYESRFWTEKLEWKADTDPWIIAENNSNANPIASAAIAKGKE